MGNKIFVSLIKCWKSDCDKWDMLVFDCIVLIDIKFVSRNKRVGKCVEKWFFDIVLIFFILFRSCLIFINWLSFVVGLF